jgi:RNA polymerase sigma-70 factor (ECF subfamily)
MGMAAVISYAVAVRLPFGRSAGEPLRDDADAPEVRAAAAGDEAAFETLVLRHQRSLFNLALRLLGDRADAEDAVQEAFLRAYRALPRFRGDALFRTWLTGIAINVCRTRLAGAEARRRRVTSSLVQRDPATGEEKALPVPDQAPNPEAKARAGETRAALERALAALTPEHREVILLREVNGLEYEELAAVLGCALGTVKSRIARARGALRQALEGVWP